MRIYDQVYRRLSQATVTVLFSALGFFVLALACAIVGFRNAATTFSGVSGALAYVFAGLFVFFLIASLVRLVLMFFTRRFGHEMSQTGLDTTA